MTAIFLLSHQPSLPTPPGVGDKEMHAATYGGLAALLVRAFAGATWTGVTGARAAAAAAGAIVYGISDELHQSFVPGRTADLQDLLADAFGAACIAAVAYAWGIIHARRQRSKGPSVERS
jgi:VanZ family protein